MYTFRVSEDSDIYGACEGIEVWTSTGLNSQK